MKLFSCKFEGYWPVGAVAIVLAPDVETARNMLAAKLKQQHLALKDDDEIIEIDLNQADVHILLDGNY